MAGRSQAQVRIDRQRAEVRSALSRDLRAARLDVGATQAAVAAAAGISRAYMCEIEAGHAVPSVDVLAAIASALGRRLSLSLLPDTDPLVRDHRQAPIVEALVRALHPGWRAALEVPVYRPVHGVIDVVLDAERDLVCVEVQSQLRAIEATIRWGRQKAEALLTSGPWGGDEKGPPVVSRVLAIASTRSNREIVATFQRSIEVAYPAAPEAVVAALTRPDTPWPGSGLLWFTVDDSSAHLLPGSPRGLHAISGRRRSL